MKNGTLLLIGSCIFIVIGILFIGLTTAADDENREQARRRIELKQSSSKTTTKSEKVSFYLDDRTSLCAGERELLYEDTEFKYYLPCYKSRTIYIVYSNKNEITVREALDTNSITISELINNGLDLIKEAV